MKPLLGVKPLLNEVRVFVKLWFLLFISYLLISLAFDLAYFGWIDLRQEVITRAIYLPIGQALIFQLVTLPRRRDARRAS